ncbi:MAG: redox-regulated ATPase YchF [Candidatus Margulisiibacteriota bacterium]|nr:MAG: redox-regulated ATPase YchF [Candidatus Margulisbacteria bacterium GWD2_39_127]OGI02423.1 MAG: redox-regulated ATPase YchF [Candidatus Margulisbacteria bacterium GWF2_38_17]OGI08556.1 MAG: redox-regulated ATPase YchF [Candidatus Margulisbacteria bacterium GWE2_39_32]PZM78209.1 MAG: redox-regulated ATPase YchF [Candidatus Margulisiibacteriota bacterium]HAR63472.1 redox-regulated ATPase YchF [Candidatus Margulisiibacteriota bacterium]
MGLSLGIVGLPNVGKSTLFNAITKAGAKANNFPFCTIDPNIGVVAVPDERLEVLGKINNSVKTVPASIEFVDIAGLVKGAHKGEGLGNQFLANIREVEAILHVVRCFEDDDIIHVDGSIDPVRDIEIIELELLFADLATIEKRLSGQSKKIKSGDKQEIARMEVYEKIKKHLDDNKLIRYLELTDKEKELIKELHFLTEKPVIYVANIAEDSILTYESDPFFKRVKEYAEKSDDKVIAISSKIEAELAELTDEEGKEYLLSLGLNESGLKRLIRLSYQLLNLQTYLTSGPTETRAWTIHTGSKAPAAAGVIHTDFERGFIKAEIVSYNDLIAAGTYAKAKEKGLIRQEGKEYVMNDGDIVEFKFNV